MTVMIVDDSTEMRGLLRDLVSPVADQVFECADGAEFLVRYGECRPDWTVMDVRMPRLDGLNATRALHACHPQARVVLMTQFPSAEMTSAALDAGAAGCLPKEDLGQLMELLKPSSAS